MASRLDMYVKCSYLLLNTCKTKCAGKPHLNLIIANARLDRKLSFVYMHILGYDKHSHGFISILAAVKYLYQL